jgi:hypothetical protein
MDCLVIAMRRTTGERGGRLALVGVARMTHPLRSSCEGWAIRFFPLFFSSSVFYVT